MTDDEANGVRRWMEERGAKFLTGPNEEEHLTDNQIRQQCQMYVAALRLAPIPARFGAEIPPSPSIAWQPVQPLAW